MAESGRSLSHQQQQQLHRQSVMQQMRLKAAQQQQQKTEKGNGDRIERHQMAVMPFSISLPPRSDETDSAYNDLPCIVSSEFGFFGPSVGTLKAFESACRDGHLSTVKSIISSASETRTPPFLHHGLVIALSTGNIELSRYLLSIGAPISQTPSYILQSPANSQVALFELLAEHGWTPNTPGNGSNSLLPSVVKNKSLLRWFLSHGANPNHGPLQYRGPSITVGGPDANSCAALEAAASHADVEAVRMLLDAGARIQNGVPLHYAAGACPPKTNPHYERVMPSKEFDESRIPVMALLVERGAAVNYAEETQHMVPRYAIIHAVMAGAVERVRWLLEHGANPELKGAFGSAVLYATRLGSQEMKEVIEDGIKARRWIGHPDVDDGNPIGP